MGRPLLIYGSGGSGREIAAWAEQSAWEGVAFTLAGFIDDAADGPVNGRPAWPLAEAARAHPGAAVVAAVGSAALRRRLISAAEAAGLVAASPLVAPGTVHEPAYVDLAAGVIICPGSVVTTNISIGAHTQVNVNCTITHDTRIGAYVTLSPGVQLSGTNVIGDDAFLGTGAVSINGVSGSPLQIGAGATVGAGAVITTDVRPGVTVVGVPAREIPAKRD